mgnify:CR=1 FL=1
MFMFRRKAAQDIRALTVADPAVRALLIWVKIMLQRFQLWLGLADGILDRIQADLKVKRDARFSFRRLFKHGSPFGL